jgi:two-component system, NarL family, response regulator, fimbrial Z protein, FimZ
MQIFKLMAEGNGNPEIMNMLQLQSSTVSTHKKRIFEKLTIENISELIKIYEKLHEQLQDIAGLFSFINIPVH